MIAFGIAALSLGGCVTDVHKGGKPNPVGGDGKLRLELFTRMPDYVRPATRTGEAQEEALGSTPWVIVFSLSNSDYLYTEAAQAYTMAGKIFVDLTPTDIDSKLLVIANPQEKFTAAAAATEYEFTNANFDLLLTGKTLAETCGMLHTRTLSDPQTAVPFAGITPETQLPLPMSGIYPATGTTAIDRNTSISVALTRAVAKVVVTSSALNFTLEGATVLDAPRRGRLHQLGTALKTNAASDRTDYLAAAPNEVKGIAAVPEESQTTETNPIYVYESAKGDANHTHVIVQGLYNNETNYYKLSFRDPAATASNPNAALDIERNNIYTFRIMNVLRAGYTDLDDAINAARSSNEDIVWRIDVTDGNSHDIIDNGEYYLGVTNSRFIVYGDGAQSGRHAFTVTTNRAGALTDNSITASEGLTVVAPANGKISHGNPGTTEVRLDFDAGFTTGTVTLRLGDIIKVVTVEKRASLAGAQSRMAFEGDYLTARVEHGLEWLTLSADGVAGNGSHIAATGGNIYIHPAPYYGASGSAAREGVVFMARTDDSGGRIKLDIAQNVNAIVEGLALAPPGVIGIKHSDLTALREDRVELGDGSYSLTLRGSNTYKGTWVENIATRDANIGALEEEPVYVVYFKWGSTVGVIADKNSSGYRADDVVWVNYGFNTGLIHANDWDNAANFAPAAPTGIGSYDIPAHVSASGWGDACDFVNGGTASVPGGWKTPIGGPWTFYDTSGTSTPFGTYTDYPAVSMTWADARSQYGATARWTDSFGGGAVSDDEKLFLPAAGLLDRYTGAMYTGQADYGSYWSASASPSAGHSYSLNFAKNDLLSPSNRAAAGWGNPIRCINCQSVGNVTVAGDIDGTPFTSDPNLAIGNVAETVRLTANVSTQQAARWHWEYAIGDDASWIKVPNSDGKTTLVSSTHDDEPGIDFTMVGGTNRFRVVLSNACSKVFSNVITVSLRLPELTYAVIGYDIYSWGSNRQTALNVAINNARGVLNANNPDAIIKTAGLKRLWSATTTSAATTYLRDGFTGTVGGVQYVNAKPDILLYFSYPLYPNANLTTALVNYIAARGTVLYAPACDDATRIQYIGELLDGVFPGEGITATLKSPNDDDNAYRIWDLINNRDLKDDPIVNGPFGDLSGGECFIGDENFATTCVPVLPAGSVQIAALRNFRTAQSAAYPESHSFCWYNTAKNFFYIGDCTAAISSSTDTRGYAAIYNYSGTSATGMPGSKMYGFYDNGTTSGTRRVYNAVLEMNALAWCMTRAARNGINPH